MLASYCIPGKIESVKGLLVVATMSVDVSEFRGQGLVRNRSKALILTV